ncbi:MAG: hypothetical protein WCY88_08950 [Spongiibacteraceae bacterium]
MASQQKKWYRRRGVRTVFLALFATICFVGAAIFTFDVDAWQMLQFFVVCIIGLICIMAAALAATALRVLLKRLF